MKKETKKLFMGDKTVIDLIHTAQKSYVESFKTWNETTVAVNKIIKDNGYSSMSDWLNQSRSPKDQMAYSKAKVTWDEVNNKYKEGRCISPMPPVMAHRKVSPHEHACHNGHKLGYQLAARFMKVIINDTAKEDDGKLSDANRLALKKKSNYYLRCMKGMNMNNNGTIFSICYTHGVRDARNEYIDTYNTAGLTGIDKIIGEEKLKERIIKDYDTKYADYLDKPLDTICSSYNIKNNGTNCGSKGKYYCNDIAKPMCVAIDNNKKNDDHPPGVCKQVHDQIVPVGQYDHHDFLRSGYSALCICKNGRQYYAECKDKDCKTSHCNKGTHLKNTRNNTNSGNVIMCSSNDYQEQNFDQGMRDTLIEFSFNRIPYTCLPFNNKVNFEKWNLQLTKQS